ncbi:MAG: DNA endonuclease SmrA [Cellvibrionaceae bacterium]
MSDEKENPQPSLEGSPDSSLDGSFADLVGDDVAPIKKSDKADISKKQEVTEAHIARQKAAVQGAESKADPLSSEEHIPMLHPLDELNYKKDGVQHGVFKNLRLGKYSIDARLDLHRHTIEQARRALFEFIRDCMDHDIRCILITHGKGEGREKPALLKSCVAFWLPEIDEVLAFHSAQKRHGGLGATYVLLKKSERKKLEAKEAIQRW